MNESSTASQAEYALQMMVVISMEITVEQRSPSSDNIFFKFITYILSKNMLNTNKCIYSNPVAVDRYLEMVYRWSIFFKN